MDHLAEIEELILRSIVVTYLQPYLIGPVTVNGLQTLGIDFIGVLPGGICK